MTTDDIVAASIHSILSMVDDLANRAVDDQGDIDGLEEARQKIERIIQEARFPILRTTARRANHMVRS